MSKILDVYISKEIVEKLENNEAEISDVLEYKISNFNFEKRERIKIKIDNELYRKIKKIKNQTEYPYWVIIEDILKNYMKKDINYSGNKTHNEPDYCPECGSNELLINEAHYNWYCYDCQERGDF